MFLFSSLSFLVFFSSGLHFRKGSVAVKRTARVVVLVRGMMCQCFWGFVPADLSLIVR